MESRVERYKRRRRESFIRRLKFIVVLIVISLMAYGMNIVNENIKTFNILENDNLIHIDLRRNTVDFLGKTYYVDIEMIKNVFKQ
ncbi:MAG: hypothetical protein GX185_05890 [Tissierellia bacterium]|mgnify:CR=1 FL=1|nr:hypothetical protein [Tissierellia bacterium]